MPDLYAAVKDGTGKATGLQLSGLGPVIPFTTPQKPPNPLDVPGMTLLLNEQFAAIDTTKWKVYDNSNFGAPDRIQLYKAANVAAGAGASAGATGGTSLRLYARKETTTFNNTTYNYTAGMLDTKSTGTYYPRYGRFEVRCKLPHGQGIWPSDWLTSTAGASVAEFDIVEYFHAAQPGYNRSSLHAFNATGTHIQNKYTNNTKGAFFEHPTFTPGWHTYAVDIVPVTDATGNTQGDIHAPSTYVRFVVYQDGAQVYRFVDTSANLWTVQGGTEDRFWQWYLQGSQIDGPWVGGPNDPLGYAHNPGRCLIGTATANPCATTQNSVDFVRYGQFTDPASTHEIDYIRVWKLTS